MTERSLPRTCAVGTDVSKDKLDAALLTPAGQLHEKSVANEKSVVNEESDFGALLRWARRLLSEEQKERLRFVLEASGGYQEEAAGFFHQAGLHVAVVNPSRTSAYAKSQLQRSKTDRTDARLLARFARREKPSRWQPPSDQQRDLRQMTRGLEALKKERDRLKNQLGATASEAVAASLRAVLESVEEQIEELKGKVEAHTRSCQKLARRSELLETIPGVGRLTAALVMAELGDPARFKSARQAAAYAGLVPSRHQSGTSREVRCKSKAGSRRSAVRACARPSTSRPSRSRPSRRSGATLPPKAFGQRLSERGKAKMVVVGAAMRKLLHICYGVLKSGRPFDASLHPGT